MSDVSDKIREIEQEIASLYRRKRVLEMEQQREWSEMFPPMTAMQGLNDADSKSEWMRLIENPGPEWMADSEINYDYLVNDALWG
jgi:hypothetical protein